MQFRCRGLSDEGFVARAPYSGERELPLIGGGPNQSSRRSPRIHAGCQEHRSGLIVLIHGLGLGGGHAGGLYGTPQASGRQRPSFSVPRLRRGVHRPAAALRSGAGMGVAGMAALPRLRWPGSCPVHGAGVLPQASSRGCAAGWAFRAESAAVVYLSPRPPAHGAALRRSIAPQRLCRSLSAFVLVE